MNLFEGNYDYNLYASAVIIYKKNRITFRLFPMPTCCQLMILKTTNKSKPIFLTKTQLCVLDNKITYYMKKRVSADPTTVMIDGNDKHMYFLYEKLQKINSKINYIIV